MEGPGTTPGAKECGTGGTARVEREQADRPKTSTVTRTASRRCLAIVLQVDADLAGLLRRPGHPWGRPPQQPTGNAKSWPAMFPPEPGMRPQYRCRLKRYSRAAQPSQLPDHLSPADSQILHLRSPQSGRHAPPPPRHHPFRSPRRAHQYDTQISRTCQGSKRPPCLGQSLLDPHG